MDDIFHVWMHLDLISIFEIKFHFNFRFFCLDESHSLPGTRPGHISPQNQKKEIRIYISYKENYAYF